MRKILLFVLLAAVFALFAPPCRACVLVKGGRAAAVIVLGEDAAATEKNAASELQSYIEQISGARLEIAPAASAERHAWTISSSLRRQVSRITLRSAPSSWQSCAMAKISSSI